MEIPHHDQQLAILDDIDSLVARLVGEYNTLCQEKSAFDKEITDFKDSKKGYEDTISALREENTSLKEAEEGSRIKTRNLQEIITRLQTETTALRQKNDELEMWKRDREAESLQHNALLMGKGEKIKGRLETTKVPTDENPSKSETPKNLKDVKDFDQLFDFLDAKGEARDSIGKSYSPDSVKATVKFLIGIAEQREKQSLSPLNWTKEKKIELLPKEEELRETVIRLLDKKYGGKSEEVVKETGEDPPPVEDTITKWRAMEAGR